MASRLTRLLPLLVFVVFVVATCAVQDSESHRLLHNQKISSLQSDQTNNNKGITQDSISKQKLKKFKFQGLQFARALGFGRNADKNDALAQQLELAGVRKPVMDSSGRINLGLVEQTSGLVEQTSELKGGDDAFLEVKSKTKLRAQTMAEAVSGKRLGRRNANNFPGLPSLNTLKKGAMAVAKGAINIAKKNSADQIEACVGCQFIWAKVHGMLDQSAGPEAVKSAFENVCFGMPDVFYDVCDSMYRQEEGMIKDYLEDQSFQDMCVFAGICWMGITT